MLEPECPEQRLLSERAACVCDEQRSSLSSAAVRLLLGQQIRFLPVILDERESQQVAPYTKPLRQTPPTVSTAVPIARLHPASAPLQLGSGQLTRLSGFTSG